jgi:general secretion pathway protein J
MTFSPRARRHLGRRRAGITLIEAMVSIAILSIVSTMIWQAFSQTSRNKRIVEEEADRYHVISTALDRMAREISMAFVSTHVNDSIGLIAVRTAFVGTDRSSGDRLDFTSFSHQRLYRDAHESDQNELSYFVTRDPENGQQRVLARREQNRIDDRPEEGGRVQILVENIENFQLEYYENLTGEWKRTWDTTQIASEPNRLPYQVKIILTVPDMRNPRREMIFATRTTIPTVWGLNHANYNP